MSTIIPDAPSMRTHLDALHQQGYDLDIRATATGFTVTAIRTTEITVSAPSLDEALAKADAQAPGDLSRVFAALGEYAWRYECASHPRSMLLAALIAGRHRLDPDLVVDLAREEPFDDRVREAGRMADELVAEARRRWEAAEYGEAAPAEGQVSRG